MGPSLWQQRTKVDHIVICIIVHPAHYCGCMQVRHRPYLSQVEKLKVLAEHEEKALNEGT